MSQDLKTLENQGSEVDCTSLMQVHAGLDGIQIKTLETIILDLPYLWLRDNCPCPDCRVSATQEKSFILSSVPADIIAKTVELFGGELKIVWPDEHCSNFAIKDILDLSHERHNSSQTWREEFQPSYFDWSLFLTDQSTAINLIEHFIKDGVVIIDNAPTEPLSLELLATRLGPVREVLFDRIHNVCVDTHVYNVAHTPMALPPHNDFASYTHQPSAQALHMLVNEAEGGASIIVDAWQIAEEIRVDRPEFFNTLCQFAVPFREFDESNETYCVQPVITCDTEGKVTNVRFSNQLMQMIDPTIAGVAKFYLAYHDLCCRITDRKNYCTFRLEGGQVLLVASNRVLHAREAFNPIGKRHLQDAYFDYDNIANMLVTLKRNKESN